MSSLAVSSVLCGVAVAAVAVAVSPYPAGLTMTVPDRANASWWRPMPTSRHRIAVTAAVGAACGLLGGLAAAWTAALPAFLLLTLVVAPLVIIDVEHHRLPDRLVGLAAIGGLGLLAVAGLLSHDAGRVLRVGEATALVFTVSSALTVIARFGFGDTKLGAVLAGYLGWFGWGSVLYGMMAGFLVASLGVVPLLVSGRATMKSAMAFGPAMILGALLVMARRGGFG
jgi:leader peptidase (prepilin peptidase) / N-methyltransferase